MRSIIYAAYSKDLSVKTTSAKIQMMKQGKYVGGYAPYGYVLRTDFRSAVERCSSHYIVYDELYEIVLRDIQQMLYEVKNNNRMVMAKINADDVSEEQQIEREIEALEMRIAGLESKFDRLYVDRLDGILSDKQFKERSVKCEAEQESVSARLTESKMQTDANRS